MTVEILNNKNHPDLQIGHYCQVHEENTPNNSNHTHTKGYICMGPRRNIQGGFKFMNVKSMKYITS